MDKYLTIFKSKFGLLTDKVKPFLNNSLQKTNILFVITFILIFLKLIGAGLLSDIFMLLIVGYFAILFKSLISNEKEFDHSFINFINSKFNKEGVIDIKKIDYFFEGIIIFELCLLVLFVSQSSFLCSLFSFVLTFNLLIIILRSINNKEDLKKENTNKKEMKIIKKDVVIKTKSAEVKTKNDTVEENVDKKDDTENECEQHDKNNPDLIKNLLS